MLLPIFRIWIQAEAIDALTAGEIDVAIFTSQLGGGLLQRALDTQGSRLMNVAPS